MKDLGTHQRTVLFVPDNSCVEAAQQLCAGKLHDCVVDVRVELEAQGLGEAIACALETGNAKALRQAATSSSLNALPAAFPINNTRKLVAAHALLLVLDGVPGVHWHHLQTSQPKTFESLAKLLRTRATHQAFASGTPQQILDLPTEVFGLLCWTAEEEESPLRMQRSKVVCLVNVSPEAQLISLDWRALLGTRNAIRDLISGVRFNVHGPSLELQPHQVVWATL